MYGLSYTHFFVCRFGIGVIISRNYNFAGLCDLYSIPKVYTCRWSYCEPCHCAGTRRSEQTLFTRHIRDTKRYNRRFFDFSIPTIIWAAQIKTKSRRSYCFDKTPSFVKMAMVKLCNSRQPGIYPRGSLSWTQMAWQSWENDALQVFSETFERWKSYNPRRGIFGNWPSTLFLDQNGCS